MKEWEFEGKDRLLPITELLGTFICRRRKFDQESRLDSHSGTCSNKVKRECPVKDQHQQEESMSMHNILGREWNEWLKLNGNKMCLRKRREEQEANFFRG